MSEHLAEAVEAVARMLPLRIFEDGKYGVARAALKIADPHLSEHYRSAILAQLKAGLLALHAPDEADHDGLRVCVECAQAVPCPTVRLVPAQA